MNKRRQLLTGLISFTAGLFSAKSSQASEHDVNSLRFPGDPTDHNVVYQFNKADQDYHQAVLHSVGEMIRKYGDNVTIVVAVFGKGIHILAKQPVREVSNTTKQRVKSLADYGVQFHACGNTMKSLDWTKKDMLPLADIVKVGAADIIELQEKGFSYISW